MAEIVLDGPATAGLPEMIAELVRANMAADPAREHLVERRRGAAEITVVDAGVVVALAFVPGVLTVRAGAVPGADLRVAGTADDVLGLSAVPLRRGLPDPLSPEGRQVLRAVATGRLRVRARPGGLGLLRTLMRLLSVRASRPASGCAR